MRIGRATVKPTDFTNKLHFGKISLSAVTFRRNKSKNYGANCFDTRCSEQ